MMAGKVVVIGAGPCGLAACKALGEAGIEYECLEASDEIGGVWNVEKGQSGAYRSLHTNTSTRAMAYSDFPFGPDYPTYPNAEEMLRYFEQYAARFGLKKHIRFGQRVSNAEPLDDGNWRVDVVGRDASSHYSAVIVATGQYVLPRRPDTSSMGTFEGDDLHVFDYLDPVTPIDCRDKNVLIVGLGSSAAELAAELSNPDPDKGTARKVLLSARSGRWVIPKMIDGKPMDHNVSHPSAPPPALFRFLPSRLGKWLMRRIMRTVIRRLVEKSGTPGDLGLPVPTIEPWEERPTMSLDFVPALRAGRIDVRPNIDRFEGRRVFFDDHSSAEADVIIWATGYELDFPFLSSTTLGCEARDLTLYHRIAHVEHDTLFFIGCCRVTCSMWPVAEQQSEWIVRLLGGDFELPSAEDRQRRAVSLARSLPVLCNFYVDELRRQSSVEADLKMEI